MARITVLDKEDEETSRRIGRSLQSAPLNFLIGSGGSWPGIPVAGNVEQEIEKLFAEGKTEEAERAMCAFISSVQVPTNKLIAGEANAENSTSVAHYEKLLSTLERILVERATDLLPKHANLFTTNYDLYVESANDQTSGLKLIDGFDRKPSLLKRPVLSTQTYFESTYNVGNLYTYKVEVPTLNLIKFHGSLSWLVHEEEVVYEVAERPILDSSAPIGEIRDLLSEYALVLPQVEKHRQTTMTRIYYDLLRIYQNQLDKENSLLIVFGFSFGDKHILELTLRALKNATLKLLIFSFTVSVAQILSQIFAENNNVEIICPNDGENIDFDAFVTFVQAAIPFTRR